MPTLPVYNTNNEKVSEIEVSDSIFAAEVRPHLFYDAVRYQMAKRRSGNHAVKSRSQVSGGGKKPFRQKGTGRARAGTIRSPIWRGGGVTFAAKTRDYSAKVNKKMYRGAMQSILSELVRQERLVVTEDFSVEAPKTKEVLQRLTDLNLNQVLVVVEEVDENLYLGARNLRQVDVIDVQGVNPVNLLGYEKVLFTVGALKKAEEMLG